MAGTLEDGSRVGIIGGGPAGSFFGYFLLDLANRVGLHLEVDCYEFRDFSSPGPGTCNMCAGVVSESLVQHLAVEGINLPSSVVQRGIDSYVLHTDRGSVKLETPPGEKRIAAVHRGPGPRDISSVKWESLDGYLQRLAVEKGVRSVKARVAQVSRSGDRLELRTREGSTRSYDLVAVASGINTATLRLFEGLGIDYRSPATTQASISEYRLGAEGVERWLGASMHVFLLDIPRLSFAAIIPKGDYVTTCLLGENVDRDLVRAFLSTPPVRDCFPPDWQWDHPSCNCSPRINISGALHPYADGLLFIGDSGVTRLYKDGIGAAYRLAKAAANAAVFHGISREALRAHYWPACRLIARDNTIGKFLFFIEKRLQKWGPARQAIMRMAAAEQLAPSDRVMSSVLWDMFTGSAPYQEILERTLRPSFLGQLTRHLAASVIPSRSDRERWQT